MGQLPESKKLSGSVGVFNIGETVSVTFNYEGNKVEIEGWR